MQTYYEVKKYDHRIKELLNSKSKVEPYLHAAITEEYQQAIYWAVYIWDTRNVIESGIIAKDIEDFESISKELAWYLKSDNRKGARKALDSWELLNGQGKAVKFCNSMFTHLTDLRSKSVQETLLQASVLLKTDEPLAKRYLSKNYRTLYLPEVQRQLKIKELPKLKSQQIQVIIDNLTNLK